VISLDEMWRETVPVKGDGAAESLRAARLLEEQARARLAAEVKALAEMMERVEIGAEAEAVVDLLQEHAETMDVDFLRRQKRRLGRQLDEHEEAQDDEDMAWVMDDFAERPVMRLMRALEGLEEGLWALAREEKQAMQMVKGGRL
jgi:hypothetical protein